MSANKEELLALLAEQYPPVLAAYAYGSGVVAQAGYDYSSADPSQLPMLDLIFVVEDAEKWHAANMARNREHYTSFAAVSAGVVAWIQERLGAHVWFNAYIPMNTARSGKRMLKYGVIERGAFLRDLRNWDNLYIAGRLHKPVLVVKSTPEVDEAFELNRRHAVRAAVLLMPKIFSELDLYLAVASLSYIGDPRMLVGENPRKVINLVLPTVPHYRQAYSRALQALQAEPTSLPLGGTLGEVLIASSEPVLRLVVGPAAAAAPSSSAGAGAAGGVGGVGVGTVGGAGGSAVASASASAFVSAASGPGSDSGEDTIYRQDGSRPARLSLCLGLPPALKRLLLIPVRARFSRLRPPTRAALRTALASLVAKSAGPQSLKGLLTVGVVKSAAYVFAKMGKRFFGR